MYSYAVGQRWPPNDTAPHDTLPPGDSFGVYWRDDGGLFLLVAAEQMRPVELGALRTGKPVLHFGRTRPGALLVTAFEWPGFGWVDCVTAHVVDPNTNRYEAHRNADLWRLNTPMFHGTMTGIVVARDRVPTVTSPTAGHVRIDQTKPTTVDHIAVLRYFTLSPAATRYVGRVLERCYAEPPLTPGQYTTEVTEHQRRHTNPRRWAEVHAAVKCRAGD